MSLHGGPQGRVWLVGAGPGEADLITVRGAEVLSRAEVVLHDALSHPELLELCTGAEIVDVGKRYGERSPPQDYITALLLKYAKEGRRVVRLKGGDPMTFARGAEEALALAEGGIPFEIVPGISSPVAASAFSGISLTHRDASSSVTFITGSDREGLEWSPEAWKKLATATGTICVLMGMRRIEDIASAIIAGGRSPTTPAAVVMWAARPEQRTVVAPLVEIAETARKLGLTSPSIIIVGEVVALREQLNWYETKPLFGRKILVPRAMHQAKATVQAIRERGARAIVAPAIEIGPTQAQEETCQTLERMGAFDWVIFTSENGVQRTFDLLSRLGKDARALGASRVAAIGPKTAQALSRRGIAPDVVAEEYVAEGLLASLEPHLASAQSVLILRAEQARDVIPKELERRGIRVTVAPVYRTTHVTGSARQELIAAFHASDTLLFTSSSIAESVIDVVGTDASLWAGKIVLSIGPVTSATLSARGIQVTVQASSYTVEGALDAMVAHLVGRAQ